MSTRSSGRGRTLWTSGSCSKRANSSGVNPRRPEMALHAARRGDQRGSRGTQRLKGAEKLCKISQYA